MTDAAERAAFSQNVFSLRVAGGTLLFSIALSLLIAQQTGSSFLWPLFIALGFFLGVLLSIFSLSRFLLRSACRLLSCTGRDPKLVLLSRAALVSVLVPEAVTGLLLLGTFTIAERSLGSQAALGLTFLGASVTSVTLLVFARSAAASVRSALIDTSRSSSPPHAPSLHSASLAEVVAATFGRSLLSLAILMTVSSLGHVLLLAHSVGLNTELHPSTLLYPHLLRWIGLLALSFGAFVVRSSEREPTSWAWLRGAGVTVLLLLGGAWSLAQSLESDAPARLLPSQVSFLLLGIVALIWLASIRRTAPQAPLWMTRLSWGIGFAFLCVAGLSLIRLLSPDTPLPLALNHSLLTATILAIFPLAHLFRVAQEIQRGAQRCEPFVSSPAHPAQQVELSPPRSLSLPYWPLLLVLGFEAARLSEPAETDFLSLALAALLGLSALLLALGRSALTCDAAQRAVTRLRNESTSDTSSVPGFSEALDAVLPATRAGWLSSLLFVLGLPLLYGGLRALELPIHPGALGLGLGLGALLSGLSLSWLQEEEEAPTFNGHSSLASLLALTLVIWLSAATHFLTL